MGATIDPFLSSFLYCPLLMEGFALALIILSGSISAFLKVYSGQPTAITRPVGPLK